MAGLLFAAVACLGLLQDGRLPGGLVVGLVLLTAGALVSTVLPHTALVGTALALPGAWVVAVHAGVPSIGWVRWVVILTIVVGGALVADFDERWGSRGYGQVLLAVSTLGVYVTVPDTERAVLVLAAAVLVALSGWPHPVTAVGRAGSYAVVAVVAWVAAVDGVGRHSSFVGGIACLGILVIEPVVCFLSSGRSPLDLGERVRFLWLRAIVVGAGQLALVLVAARVAGMQAGVRACLLILAVEMAVVFLIGLTIARRASDYEVTRSSRQ